MNNKIVREVLEFVKENQAIFHHNLKGDISGADEFTLERVNLVVSILSKVQYFHFSVIDSLSLERPSMQDGLLIQTPMVCFIR